MMKMETVPLDGIGRLRLDLYLDLYRSHQQVQETKINLQKVFLSPPAQTRQISNLDASTINLLIVSISVPPKKKTTVEHG